MELFNKQQKKTQTTKQNPTTKQKEKRHARKTKKNKQYERWKKRKLKFRRATIIIMWNCNVKEG